MRCLLLILVLLPFLSFTQDRDAKWWLNRYKWTSPLAATAGFLDGTSEVLWYNYSLFDKTWGIQNDEYWNPRISYRNKWKNGDFRQGEKFFLSSTVLSPFVEGRKLVRMGSRFIWAAQAVVPVIQHENIPIKLAYSSHTVVLAMVAVPLSKKQMFDQPWWVYAVDLAVNFGVQAVAFELTSKMYRKHL